MRIGIYGGSFNPVHYGHIKCAQFVKEKFQLDCILFVPVFRPYHRENTLLPFEVRVQLLEKAFGECGCETFQVSSIEKELGDISYTIDTLRALKKQFKSGDFFEIIGEDSYDYFKTWKEYEEIIKLSKLIVLAREGKKLHSFDENIVVVENPIITISASDIRSRVKEGASLEGLLPKACIEYINEKRIWRV